MSGAMRRIGEYLGLVEESDRIYDEELDDHAEEPARQERRPAPVADLAERRRPQPVQTPGAIAELSRITTLHPRTYNEARTVGENYREGVPVIMNLSEMEGPDAKRLVDFSAGLIFGLRGTIERVTNKVFLLSPATVEVASEQHEPESKTRFFNQS